MPNSVVAVMAAQSISGGGGASYQFRDQFNGASKDLALYEDPTTAPAYNPTTIGGSDSQSSGTAIITATASAIRQQGRKTLLDTYTLNNGQVFAAKIDPSSFSVTGMVVSVGLVEDSGQNIRWQFENGGGGSIVAQGFCSNFGITGTTFDSGNISASIANWRWVLIGKDGTDLVMWSAPDSANAPGTLTERRRIASGAGEYITTASLYAAAFTWNQAPSTSPSPFVFDEWYLTA